MGYTLSDTFYVKLYRTGFETVLFVGSETEAQAEAAALNEQYQTTEYIVEPYDAKKAKEWW